MEVYLLSFKKLRKKTPVLEHRDSMKIKSKIQHKMINYPLLDLYFIIIQNIAIIINIKNCTCKAKEKIICLQNSVRTPYSTSMLHLLYMHCLDWVI